MANDILNSLLKEYEQKKIKAEYQAEKKKRKLIWKSSKVKRNRKWVKSICYFYRKNILNDSNFSYAELQQKAEKLKKEKKEILASLDLPENYLKPFYECTICNDAGYIMSENYKTTMCNCLKQKLLNDSFNKSNISNLEKENFNNFNEDIFSNEVDIAKYNFNISPRTNISNIRNKCIQFVENFDDINQKNLLFVGNTGLR